MLAAVLAGAPAAALAGDRVSVCPDEPKDPMQTVTVFDGPPPELASLVPEEGQRGTWYWDLAYVYEAGRHVWVQCNYRSKAQKTVELPQPVQRCTFQSRPKGVHRLWCTPAVVPVVRP